NQRDPERAGCPRRAGVARSPDPTRQKRHNRHPGETHRGQRVGPHRRVAAADLILRITAFFNALAELLEQHHCPFTLRDLRFTRDEQYRLFSDVLRGIEQDTPTLPPASGGPELATPYRKAAGVLLLFLRGLEVWDRLDDAERTRVTETLEELPSRACRRHIELYRKLAADVPEFGVWANFSAHEKTQEQITEISTGLDELAQIL